MQPSTVAFHLQHPQADLFHGITAQQQLAFAHALTQYQPAAAPASTTWAGMAATTEVRSPKAVDPSNMVVKKPAKWRAPTNWECPAAPNGCTPTPSMKAAKWRTKQALTAAQAPVSAITKPARQATWRSAEVWAGRNVDADAHPEHAAQAAQESALRSLSQAMVNGQLVQLALAQQLLPGLTSQQQQMLGLGFGLQHLFQKPAAAPAPTVAPAERVVEADAHADAAAVLRMLSGAGAGVGAGALVQRDVDASEAAEASMQPFDSLRQLAQCCEMPTSVRCA